MKRSVVWIKENPVSSSSTVASIARYHPDVPRGHQHSPTGVLIVQLPSHCSHIITQQALDVGAFGVFERHLTDTLTSFPQKDGVRMPVKKRDDIL